MGPSSYVNLRAARSSPRPEPRARAHDDVDEEERVDDAIECQPVVERGRKRERRVEQAALPCHGEDERQSQGEAGGVPEGKVQVLLLRRHLTERCREGVGVGHRAELPVHETATRLVWS